MSTASYVFSGAGSLGGSMTLVKNGSGTLTLTESGGDSFSGGVLVDNGSLILDTTNAWHHGRNGHHRPAATVQLGNNDAGGISARRRDVTDRRGQRWCF